MYVYSLNDGGNNIMKKALVITLSVCLLALFIGSVSAREVDKADLRVMRPWSEDEFADPALLDAGVRGLYSEAQVDTFCLVWYNFEQMNWQGWVQVDNTAQNDTFSHVDDFSGIAPGSWGGLVPIEGTKSMWCGARDWDHQILGQGYPCPGDFEYLCSWGCAPGYGNGWNQMLQTDAFEFQGLITFSYHGYFDSEPDYDQTTVEYDAGAGNWIELAMYDGVVDTIAIHELLLPTIKTKLRFHFTSDGAWSDEDCLWDTDGAFIVDSLHIQDIGGTIDYEDFETYTVCVSDTRGAGGLWWGNVEVPYGNYSGLWNNLADKDPCGDNFATQVVFFVGSPYPSSDYPGLFDVPFCKGPGGIEAPCHDEAIVSPIINMNMYSSTPNDVQDTPIPPAVIPTLGGAYLRFTVYRDLPVPNLSFYIWGVRNIDPVTGCPGTWLDRNYVYYGPDRDYIYTTQPVGDLVGLDTNGDGQTDPIQVRVGVVDMCDVWYVVYGNCANHTPSPWFDNVRFYRFVNVGPQWSWRDLDIFQDNFPEVEFNLCSPCRADAANDLRPNDDPVIDPGDSAVVTCTSPLGGGIDTTADGWPKVYCHVCVHYIGPIDPTSPPGPCPLPGPPYFFYGPQLEGTYGRYDSDDGAHWTILQCEYARTGAGNISPDKYAVDLNDSLITRGWMVEYYFKAYDFSGASSTLPSRAGRVPWPPPPDWHERLHWLLCPYMFEWTCLPTFASDVLFVDDFHGRGTICGNVEQYWMPSFKAVLTAKPDVYDVNNPSSSVSNGPGSRAKNYQMTLAYQKVIWDSGNLDECTISDGICDKSNDCQMLVDWMAFSEHRVGLWICGDDVAWDLTQSTATCPLTLMAAYCGVQWVGDVYAMTGVVNPGVCAIQDVCPHPNPMWHGTWGDSFCVFGGCPIINQFDVLQKVGDDACYALEYKPDCCEETMCSSTFIPPLYAGVYNVGVNDFGYPIRTMWFGFSFMYVRECEPTVAMMRNQVVRDVVAWMENDVNSNITEVDEVPAVNSLSQNFPNPFNPTTKIKFGLRAKGHVSIKIYDVAGRLVKTLVNEVREAGYHDVTWDGTNNRNTKVASGVYFYKMSTADYWKTNKMVLMR
jgi:hypothetical protein